MVISNSELVKSKFQIAQWFDVASDAKGRGSCFSPTHEISLFVSTPFTSCSPALVENK